MTKVIVLLQTGVTDEQAREITSLITSPGDAAIALRGEYVASVHVVEKFAEAGVLQVVGPPEFKAALQHSINYNGVDSKANMPDHELTELLMPEICKHIAGTTDVQVIERMTPEERANIGKE